MALVLRTFLTSLFAAVHCQALAPRAASAALPPSFSVTYLGQATSNFPNVTRDGGGGGTVNGENLIIFDDTEVHNALGNLTHFVPNSIAFSDPKNSLNLTDFGQNEKPKQAISFLANGTSYCGIEAHNCSRVVIWPGSSIATLSDGVTGLFVTGVATQGNLSVALYNTLVTITADASGYTTNRTVPQLFYQGELMWGNFGNLMNPLSGNLNLFVTDNTGLKVAQVPPKEYADRSKYTYWNGENWSPTPPIRNDSTANIVNGSFSSGDVFYSNYYNAFMFVYFDAYADDTFFMRYALGDGVKSPYSSEIKVNTTEQAAPKKYNYAAHAYPSFDESGKTLFLSWSYAGAYNRQALVTFK